MTVNDNVDRLIGKMLLDDEFRARVFADPTAAAAELKFKLPTVLAARIQGLDQKKADKLAAQFKRLAKVGPPEGHGILW